MKYRIALILLLALPSALTRAQEQFSEPVSKAGGTSTTATALAALPIQSPVVEIENPKKVYVSPILVQRIFRETVREVAWQLNPNRPPTILAKVTLRLGAPGFTIETIEGNERRTVLCMERWDEMIFARMVARAARNGLFSDQELDRYARSALSRARAVTSVTELQKER